VSGRGFAIAVTVVVVVGAALLAAGLTGGEEEDFAERRVAVAALPPPAREEVAAHGGGRCVEQHPSVYLCVLARPKQAHEGPGGRQWCFDSDGPQVLGAYPASRVDGAWKCARG
jgi:hypothetical protein